MYSVFSIQFITKALETWRDLERLDLEPGIADEYLKDFLSTWGCEFERPFVHVKTTLE